VQNGAQPKRRLQKELALCSLVEVGTDENRGSSEMIHCGYCGQLIYELINPQLDTLFTIKNGT
jgi:cytidine deaminase